MLPWFVGVIFIIGLFIYIYFIKISRGVKETVGKENISKRHDQGEINKNDMVLVELTDFDKSPIPNYGILWNGKAGMTYNYSISTNGIDVASGTISSNSTIFKVKGLPLENGKTYDVKVGETTVQIPFIPPSFDLDSLIILENNIDCNTSSTPTNIEVIIDGKYPVPISALQIKFEPPGFIVNYSTGGNIVIMIYNGRNAANILTLPENSPLNLSSGRNNTGETLISF